MGLLKSRKTQNMRARIVGSPAVDRYKPMSEAVFRELGENNAIKAIEAVRVDKRSYWVLIYVRFNDEPQWLFSTRSHPRVWLSLDRLAAYIEKIWSEWPGFSVVVGKRNTPVERVEAVE